MAKKFREYGIYEHPTGFSPVRIQYAKTKRSAQRKLSYIKRRAKASGISRRYSIKKE